MPRFIAERRICNGNINVFIGEIAFNKLNEFTDIMYRQWQVFLSDRISRPIKYAPTPQRERQKAGFDHLASLTSFHKKVSS